MSQQIGESHVLDFHREKAIYDVAEILRDWPCEYVEFFLECLQYPSETIQAALNITGPLDRIRKKITNVETVNDG